MKRISLSDAERLSELRSTLGDRTLRQLLTQEDKRLLRPERLRHLEAGSGKLSERETEQLRNISQNATKLKALKKRGSGRQEFKVNRSLRTWLNQGKAKDEPVGEMDIDQRNRVIKSLAFLGVDPQDGTFYVRKGE